MSSKYTLFGEVPEDWTVSTIGEIAQLRQGLQIDKSLRVQESKIGYIPLLKITDLSSRDFSEYVKDIKEQYIATERDIIYTRTGQVGLVYTDLVGCVHNNCFKVLVDYSKFDKYYIYYYLKSNQVYKYSNSVASGSVQKDLKHSSFKTCLIGYPSLQEQKAIANILSTLDEKIETNNKINKTLEEMAQAIFKHWFVDFEFPNEDGEPYKTSGGEMVDSELGPIPKGWEVKAIFDIALEVITGKTPSTRDKSNFNGTVQFVKIPDMHNKVYITKTEVYLSDKGANLNKIIPPSSIMVSCIATPGLVSLATEDCQTNQQINSIIPKDLKMSYFIYFLMSNLSEHIRVLGSTGSATLNLNKSQFEKIKVILPKIGIIHEFHNLVEPLFGEILNNQKMMENLASIRDTLLPKLMSGEIRVPIDNQ